MTGETSLDGARAFGYFDVMLRNRVFAIALALVASGALACGPELDTVPYVDTTQIQGTWFEIGHLPRTTQEGCSGTTATYTPVSDGHFAVVNACTLPNGSQLTQAATLYVVDQTSNAKLGIDLGGYIGDYWIIDVASDYRYLVVGHPSRDYLWILSRDKHMTSADLDTVLEHAKNQGFDTSRVEYTNQDGGTAEASSAGCSASTARHATGGAAFGIFALGLVALVRRRRST